VCVSLIGAKWSANFLAEEFYESIWACSARNWSSVQSGYVQFCMRENFDVRNDQERLDSVRSYGRYAVLEQLEKNSFDLRELCGDAVSENGDDFENEKGFVLAKL
jgi:hypothetical protein